VSEPPPQPASSKQRSIPPRAYGWLAALSVVAALVSAGCGGGNDANGTSQDSHRMNGRQVTSALRGAGYDVSVDNPISDQVRSVSSNKPLTPRIALTVQLPGTGEIGKVLVYRTAREAAGASGFFDRVRDRAEAVIVHGDTIYTLTNVDVPGSSRARVKTTADLKRIVHVVQRTY
jgi:hypothetical protein